MKIYCHKCGKSYSSYSKTDKKFHEHPIKFVSAKKKPKLIPCIEAKDKEIRRLRKVLKFYATQLNWSSPSQGFAAQYDPEPSPAEKDGGRMAKEALKKK